MKSHTIKTGFTGGSGYFLDARLELPIGTARAYAVASHCFTCTKDTITVFRQHAAYSKHGDGDFAQSNFTTDVADTYAAAEFLRDNYAAPSLLIAEPLMTAQM